MEKYWLLKVKFVFFLIGKLILVSLFISGCGVKDDLIMINYGPIIVQSKIDGAESVNLKVEAIDARTEKGNVGRKGDEYTILGHIIAQDDLIKTIEEAIVAELKNRGFRLDGGNVLVVTELIKFFNEFKAEGAVAEVIMNVQVKNLDGNIFFSKVILEEHIHKDVMLRSGSNAKKALERALLKAVQKLITDSDFINALFKAAKS
jgi:hypothetical protein